jgi:hypothetical protein
MWDIKIDPGHPRFRQCGRMLTSEKSLKKLDELRTEIGAFGVKRIEWK